ncbi:hypothetical protein C8R45DRAFT_1029907 [Mycena sanguinolenta]|nr:hypothetical protein C8R45DRAFT_1029907 [Mycena sanguinolenta]
MALLSLGLLFLPSLVSAQNSTSLGSLAVPLPAGNTISAGDFLTYGYEYEGDVFQQLRNITAELVDSNLNVADIMCNILPQYPQSSLTQHVDAHGNNVGLDSFSDDLGYYTSAATPPGNYQIRINGTVYNSTSAIDNDVGTPVGNLSVLSKPWVLSQPADPFLCTVPTFTPVVSVTDPNYSPIRIGQPLAGTMYYLNNISTLGLILVTANYVDGSFGQETSPATMDVVKSGSLESVGSVVLNGSILQVAGLPIDKFKLTAGAFKVRATFTDSNHSGNFTSLSDEFYIASQGPCVGLQSGTSTTGGGGGSNSSSPSTGKTGAALTVNAVPFRGLFVLFISLVAAAATGWA